MKTIKKDGKIKRVKDESADKLVTLDGWQFCPKAEFKALKGTDAQPTSQKSQKKSKKKFTKTTV